MNSRGRLVIVLIGLTVFVGALSFLRWAIMGRNLPVDHRNEIELRILSYSTFIGSSGPGPQLIEDFKKQCGCKVTVVTAGDAGLLLERLKLTQSKSGFDVVIGFDQNSRRQAIVDWKWQPVDIGPSGGKIFVEDLQSEFDGSFVPFDYSPLTFIYRKSEFNPPTSLEDLKKAEFKKTLSLQDPRTSSPGLQFLTWVEANYKDQTSSYLKSIHETIHSISPSWALSYGLFKKGQSKMVFSYLTSLAFHWGVEKDLDYQAVSFESGHPMQVEFAAVPEGCRQCELGREFVRGLVQPEAQALIAEKNFMFPAVQGIRTPETFKTLPQLKTLPSSSKSPNLQFWSEAFD